MPAAADTPTANGVAPAKTAVPPPRSSTHAAYTSTTYPSRALHFLSTVGRETEGTNGTAETADGTNGSTPAEVETPVTPGRLKMDIIVVGAGLGGLATAIALRRRGFDVQVFEQAPALGEVGAGIQIPPNSGRLLRRWGVMRHLAAQAVRPDGISFRRWATGERIGFTDLTGAFPDVYEEPYYVVHRAHLHGALHARAVELGVRVALDSRVVAYDAARAAVTLADGRVAQADLVVAADGVKSSARDVVGAHAQGQMRPTGFAAYRATVDVDRMMAVPELRWLLEKPALNVWIGENRHVMTYTIAAGKSFNLVLSHYDASDVAQWPKMTQEQVLSGMRQEFADWDPQLRTIIGLIDHALKWPLMGGGRLESWTVPSGRLVVLGDAAHAMLPYMSQGAAMAIEDGAALALALAKIRAPSELPFAVGVFEAERKKRSYQMQEASAVNSMIWHFADGPLQTARDAGMRAEVDGRPFITSSNQWSDPLTQAWAYGYDAEAALETAWDDAVHDLMAKA